LSVPLSASACAAEGIPYVTVIRLCVHEIKLRYQWADSNQDGNAVARFSATD